MLRCNEKNTYICNPERITAVSVKQIQQPRVRVARWFVFSPNIPVWVYFGGPWNGMDHFEYFTTIWYILWTFGIVCGLLVCLDQEKSGSPVPCPASNDFSSMIHFETVINVFVA
jgi:hypothetical protein